MQNKPLQIKFLDLVIAMQNHLGEIAYYLNNATGEVILVKEYTDGNDDEVLDESVNIKNCTPIPPIPSYKSFQFMEDFTKTVTDSQIQEHLRGAINARKPFRAFKTALNGYPKEQKRWLAFEKERLILAAREWLKTAEITADLIFDNHK